MPLAKPHRVFVFEDEGVMRWALRSLIRSSRDLSFVGESSVPLADLLPVKRTLPHLIVLDLMLPRPFQNGLDLLTRIVAELPAKVAVFSCARELFAEARRRGAHGIIEKDTDPEALVPKLVRIVQGAQDEFPPSVPSPTRMNGTRREAWAVERVRRLTKRERQAGKLMASGATPLQIAETMALRGHTVQTHFKSIFPKLEVHNRANAVRVLILGGILDDEDTL